MSALSDIRFRSSPSIELTRLDSLSPEQRDAFRELEADPDFYGLFVARPPLTMNLKSAARQTAELFRSLAAPARLDGALLADGDYAADVIDLVLDGILEIEGSDGFISGADALAMIGAPLPEPGGAWSRDALLHAEELEFSDPQTLAMALYRYNHMPITPFWKTRFANAEAILAHVGADGGTLQAMLERDWTRSEGGGWVSWRSRVAPLRRNDDDASYKLYVSPRPERIRDAFEALVRVLATVPATFKIGNRAAGLLRPDKLIAYFATREQLDEAAAMLRRELDGCDAHGVPFTAPFDGSGLLSWGVDPPENDRALRWLRRSSWRLWVVERLGGALAVAKAARTAAAVEPWRFAVARVQRLGIDVATWTPAAALWRAR